MLKRWLGFLVVSLLVVVWAASVRAYPLVQFSDEYLYHWTEVQPGLRLDVHYAGRFPEDVGSVLLFEPVGELWDDLVESVTLPDGWSYRFLTLARASYEPLDGSLGMLGFAFDEDEYNFAVVLNHGNMEVAGALADFVDLLNLNYTNHLVILLDGRENPLSSFDVVFHTRVLLTSPYVALGGGSAFFGNTKSGQPAAVPEPLTAALVGFGGLGTLYWRKKHG